MKALIYGGGAVGLGIASCLLGSGEVVDIIARVGTATALQKDGLLRIGIFGERHAKPGDFGSFASLKDVPQKSYDYVLVCTKSGDSKAAAEDIAANPRLFHDDTKVVLFQNGWGNAEIFAAHFPEDRVYNARVITGFQRPKKNVVEVTVHADSIHLGSLFGGDLSKMGALAGSIARGGIPCEVVEDVGKDLWAKMLYNCALNPLGAVFNVHYGVLGKWPYTRSIMEEVIREVFRVMEASGHSTHWESAAEYTATFYETLLPPTARHESSTLQDIRARKRTEIEALNGAVVRLGKMAGIEVPYNSMMYNMVKFMEARNLSSEEVEEEEAVGGA